MQTVGIAAHLFGERLANGLRECQFTRPTAVSGIYVLIHFVDSRIGRRNGEIDRLLHFPFEFSVHPIQRFRVGDASAQAATS